MCTGSKPKTPAPPPVLPETPSAERRVTISDKSEKRNRGRSGTILTGSQGIMGSSNSANQKTLLGA